MADIKPTLDAIDEAIEGYVTWHGSGDAMVWSAEDRIREGGIYCAPCPMCSTPIESITRGRTYADGPFQPVTYLPCGCQPGARATEGLATGGLVQPTRNPFWMLEASPTQYFATPHFEPGEVTHVSINGVDVTDMVRSVTLDNREATFTPTGIVTATPIAFRPFTEEEIALARERISEGSRQLGEGMRAFAAAVRPVFEAVGEALQQFCAIVQPLVDARSERCKQLHRAYRHRCLARRRRSR